MSPLMIFADRDIYVAAHCRFFFFPLLPSHPTAALHCPSATHHARYEHASAFDMPALLLIARGRCSASPVMATLPLPLLRAQKICGARAYSALRACYV